MATHWWRGADSHSFDRFTHDDNPLHFGDVLKLGYAMKFSPFDSVDEPAGLTGGEVVSQAAEFLI